VKTSNKSRNICNESLTPVTCTHICNSCCLAPVTNNTTRNYLICDAFSATFSENITNVHCSPEHCDDLLNSSRFYDIFLFFVTDVHWSPKHCDDLLNSSQFYDVSYFSSRMCIDGYWSPEHCDDLLNSSQFGPQRCNVWADSLRSRNEKKSCYR
jgi:hypothetical protein